MAKRGPTPRKIIFINSHPIQYFAPLYKHLNKQGLAVECWYCSDENVKGHTDRQFGTHVEWDIPLLDGYPYRFFRNRSWKPSLYNGFFGLINPGIIRALYTEPQAVVVVHGWAYVSHVMAIIFARLLGHIVCLRGESPLNQELLKSGSNRWLKRIFLQGFLFPFVNKFLFIGSQNKAFYNYFGVGESRLAFVPYAVDNERFRAAARDMRPRKKDLRKELNLPAEAKIILFAAKLIGKKRPLDLLNAYEKLDEKNKCLVIVGDGELRSTIEQQVTAKGIQHVYLAGFVNQKDISKYYAAADVFVLCSGEGETWGLSANEAMNFDLPLVVSDVAGCSFDLVQVGKNGFVSKTGDIDDLERQISKALRLENPDTSVLSIFSFEEVTRSMRSLATPR